MEARAASQPLVGIARRTTVAPSSSKSSAALFTAAETAGPAVSAQSAIPMVYVRISTAESAPYQSGSSCAKEVQSLRLPVNIGRSAMVRSRTQEA